MMDIKFKLLYLKLYTIILVWGYAILGIVAPDFLLELDPSNTTNVLLNIGIVSWITILIVGVLMYRFSVWGKYLITIELLFSWLPLSSLITIYDYVWIGLDVIILYLIWFDKSIARLFR